jgi:hypothetical protein
MAARPTTLLAHPRVEAWRTAALHKVLQVLESAAFLTASVVREWGRALAPGAKTISSALREPASRVAITPARAVLDTKASPALATFPATSASASGTVAVVAMAALSEVLILRW